jgi:hypothetical protein
LHSLHILARRHVASKARSYRLGSPELTDTPTQAHESQKQLRGTSTLAYCWSNGNYDDMVLYMYIKSFPFLFPTAETPKYSEIHLRTPSSYGSHCRYGDIQDLLLSIKDATGISIPLCYYMMMTTTTMSMIIINYAVFN